jgi:hypothetical protein
LEIVANAVAKLSTQSNTDSKNRESVDVSDLKRPHPYGFKRKVFAIHDMDAINNAAYWDYRITNGNAYIFAPAFARAFQRPRC